MFNLSPEEQRLFNDVKEMFPDVSSDAVKRNLNKGRQELTEMILDGELEMGEQYVNDHLEMKEDAPPHHNQRRKVAPMEKENEDGARQPKQRREAIEYYDEELEEEDMDGMPRQRQRREAIEYYDEELEEEDMDGMMPRHRQFDVAADGNVYVMSPVKDQPHNQGRDAYRPSPRAPRTAPGRIGNGVRRMVPGALFGRPSVDHEEVVLMDEPQRGRIVYVSSDEEEMGIQQGARRTRPAAPPPSEDEEEEPGPPTAAYGHAKGSKPMGVARMRPVVTMDNDDIYDPNDDEPPRAAKARRRSRAKTPDNDYDPNFTMRPLKGSERCSAHPGKPLIAWIECDGATNPARQRRLAGVPGKPHLICLDCLMIRHADGRFTRTDWEYCCPILRCKGLISVYELHAVLRRHAPAFLKQVRQAYLALHPPAKSDADSDEEEKEREDDEDSEGAIQAQSVPGTPVGAAARRQSQLVQLHAAATPLLKRLSQTSTVGSPLAHSTPRMQHAPAKDLTNQVWTPASSRRKDNAPAAVEVEPVVADKEAEELPITEEEADELRMMASFVDREKLKKLQAHFPETAVGWLVRHADYGLDTLSAMVVGGKADPLMRERADGRGATTLIKTTLADRKQFECSVCFSDYDEHLAIHCVYLASSRRRRTLMPGEAEEEQSAEERAREEEEEARSRKDEHKFCADCIIGHARAALEQQVIMAGGVGIKCMTPKCTRALLRAHIEQVLDMQTRAVLDPLFSSEALLAANCDDVEKCQRCMFAAVMLDTKEEQPIFVCKNTACNHAHCRKCGRTWDKLHANRTCEELDPEAVRKRVEEQLTEQSMHKCPRCKKGIVKADGCNKIACPCGQLSCYVCKAAIQNYKHFKNGPAEEHLDKCPLWKDPTEEFEKQRIAALAEQIEGAADDNIREELGRLY